MKIRKARKEDLKEIAKLMLKEFSKPPFNEKANLNSVLKSLKFYFNNSLIFVMLNKKEIIGLIVFNIEQWWEGKVCVVVDLAVRNKFQNKGVGGEFMNFLEIYSRKNQIKKISFETNKNSYAINFYKKLGYKINKNRISMEKKLK